jgi:hypothetical protein
MVRPAPTQEGKRLVTCQRKNKLFECLEIIRTEVSTFEARISLRILEVTGGTVRKNMFDLGLVGLDAKHIEEATCKRKVVTRDVRCVQ